MHCNSRELTAELMAIHCNLLQLTATYCNTLQLATTHGNARQRTATHCNSLQLTATHCNSLQLTATHCNSPVMAEAWRLVNETSCFGSGPNSIETLPLVSCAHEELPYDVSISSPRHKQMCCSVLQCVAVCCSVLQCVAVCHTKSCHMMSLLARLDTYKCVVLCCSVL